MKVFSKKKAADRTQHNLRSFSTPLRPPPLSPSSATLPTPVGAETTTNGTPSRGAGGEGGGAGADAGKPDTNNPIIKITVPANLPVDAGDVVERLKRSMMAFKQVWRRVAPEGGFWVVWFCLAGPRVVAKLLRFLGGTPRCLPQDLASHAVPMSQTLRLSGGSPGQQRAGVLMGLQ